MKNVIRCLVLLVAIVFDSVVNPRDEQTAQRRDI
jgi:ribose transport system permease protein